MPLTITTPAFRDGEVIPVRHTLDGENLSPPLEWRDAPPETKSYVLIVEDPDAPSGTFRHWAVYNISAGETGLREGASAQVLRGAGEGVNGFGKTRYDGPSRRRGMDRITTISGWPPSMCRSSKSPLRRRSRRSGRGRSPTSLPRRRLSVSTSVKGTGVRSELQKEIGRLGPLLQKLDLRGGGLVALRVSTPKPLGNHG